MTVNAILRKAQASEQGAVQELVQGVVDETYGGLWAQPPLQIDVEDWSRGWVAVVAGAIAGVMLTHEEWISDLWVLPSFRSVGIGGLLLARAESEIAERYPVGRLRVVSLNAKAQAFYKARGWTGLREFAHENLPITMIEMTKTLQGTSPTGPA